MTMMKSEERRKWAAGTHRAILWEHQGGKCAYCLREMVRPTDDYQGVRPPLNMATIDHIRPILRKTSPRDYGKLEIHNKVLSCLLCNMKKGTSVWEPRIKPPEYARGKAIR
jgi:5-methylcytosine-specific restriction endonuclease McrA